VKTILHIGQPKTGTTSLQYALANSRQQLRALNILYPRLPRWRFAHHALAPYILGPERTEPYVWRALAGSQSAALERSSRVWASVRQQVEQMRPEVLLLSSEALFHATSADKMQSFGASLRECSELVEIVVYVRNPASYALSTLSNQLQIDPDFVWPGHRIRRAVIESYGNMAPDRIHVIKFDRDELENGNVVDDFCHRFLPTRVKLKTGRDVNQSMSAEAMSVMLQYVLDNDASRHSRMGIGQQVFRRVLRFVDRRVPGYTRPRFLDPVQNALLRSCSDLEWLKNQYGIEWVSKVSLAEEHPVEAGFGRNQKISELCVFDHDRAAAIRKYMNSFPLNLLGAGSRLP